MNTIRGYRQSITEATRPAQRPSGSASTRELRDTFVPSSFDGGRIRRGGPADATSNMIPLRMTIHGRLLLANRCNVADHLVAEVTPFPTRRQGWRLLAPSR